MHSSSAAAWQEGRGGAVQVVAIANDITYSSGSFGPREDAVFRAATEHALAARLPLVYLAANSGARVGLASEVKACLQARALPAGRFRITPRPCDKAAAAGCSSARERLRDSMHLPWKHLHRCTSKVH